MGPHVYVNVHWPWPMRKPFQRKSLVLGALGGGLGDELMCLPIFEEIKRRNPMCHITFVSRRPDYFKKHPAIDEGVADGPGAVGLRLSYTYTVPPPRPLMTHLGECVGIIGHFDKINPPPISPSAAVKEFMDGLRQPIIVVQPLSSQWTVNKSWPLKAWEELVEILLQESVTIVEVGTESAFAGDRFPEGFVSVAGRTNLEDLAYVISRADVFIGPSSSGMHLANAYCVKSVIIFGGYESPSGYGFPLTTAFYSPVECAPCWKQTCPYDIKCLRAIQPAKVAAEAMRLLKGEMPLGTILVNP